MRAAGGTRFGFLHMTRRTTAARFSGLAIPKSLPVDGTVEAASSKRVKREHEAAAYAEVRKDRGAAPISVRELREEWQRLLLPSRGSASAESRESAALAADAEVPDVPPLFFGACYGSEPAQELLRRELASAIARQQGAEPLAAGELVSTGTLTESHPIAPGQTWTATVDGLDVQELTLHT